MGEPKIKITNLNKSFKTRWQVIDAVKDVNIEIAEGEFVSLLGPSGCGKSTIIRMIDDIIKPTSGEIYVDGEEITQYKRIPEHINKKMGFIFQQPNLFPWLTVRENVAFPLTIYKMATPENMEYVDELIEMVGLKDHANSYPAEISGGAAQRLGVIRALVHKPEILLMDEPFGALDAQTREMLDMELLGIWKKMNKTIIFITHNVEEAALVSQRVYIMGTNPGRIVDNITLDLPIKRTLELLGEDKFREYCSYMTNKIGNIDLSKIK